MVSPVEPGAGGPPTHGTGNDSPPSYDDATEPHPSYQIQGARQSSSSAMDFMKKLISLLAETIGCTILIGLVMAIPIAMIVIGAKYKNQCPVEEKIPIYLAVAGAVGGFRILIALGQMAKESGNQDEEEQKWKRLLDFILYCFLFVWFICGNVWIYQNYEPNYLEVRDPGYCHKTLYLFAFWITTATYILVGLYCCCGCGMCIWFTATGMLDNFPS